MKETIFSLVCWYAFCREISVKLEEKKVIKLELQGGEDHQQVICGRRSTEHHQLESRRESQLSSQQSYSQFGIVALIIIPSTHNNLFQSIRFKGTKHFYKSAYNGKCAFLKLDSLSGIQELFENILIFIARNLFDKQRLKLHN